MESEKEPEKVGRVDDTVFGGSVIWVDWLKNAPRAVRRASSGSFKSVRPKRAGLDSIDVEWISCPAEFFKLYSSWKLDATIKIKSSFIFMILISFKVLELFNN